MNAQNYRQSVDQILSKVVISSSNIRSASLVSATGVLRRFRLRDDVNLLLNPREMGELIRTSKYAAASFHRYSPKLGELRHMHLDFENIQALIFPMPDHNLFFVTLEKSEPDVSRIVAYVTRLLQSEGLIHAS